MKLSYKKIIEKKNYLPFYVYDYNKIKEQILKLKKNLPKNVQTYYSVKANPNITILRIVKKFGLGAEIVSLGELSACLKSGFQTDEIFFSGSTKSDPELASAAKQSIGLLGIESISEIIRLETICKKINKKTKIILRLNPENYLKRHRRRSTVSSVYNFGIPFEQVAEILKNFSKNFPHLDCSGIHLYATNQVYDPNILLKNIDWLFSRISKLEKRHKFNFKIINIGGGFGANFYHELSSLEFGRQLKILIKKYHFDNRKIILELGRFIVNKSGVLVANIIDVQINNGQKFIVISGILNYLIRKKPQIKISNRKKSRIINYQVDVLSKKKSTGMTSAVIRGQLSSVSDFFCQDSSTKFIVGEPKLGDMIVIRGVGAYGFTQASQSFGSRPTIAEFLLIKGKLLLTRNKGTAHDILINQRIPKLIK